ncbi:MAG: PDZ domain-containing protein [Candidatus Cloacimonetes bacterium]|nr:PDZ domain-containing protein [Candidatus Cloacimonadota bacterium]
MKRIITIALILVLALAIWAQETDQQELEKQEKLRQMEEQKKEMQLKAATMAEKAEVISAKIPGITISLGNKDILAYSSPFMGVTTESITIQKAKKLGYDKFYGVYVTGIVPGSAAHFFRVLKGDILMKFDENKIQDPDSFTNIIKSYYVGDVVRLQLFRNGQIKIIDFELGERGKKYGIASDDDEDKKDSETLKIRKKKAHVGYGGGSWIPVWFRHSMSDVNYLISQIGFSEMNDDGILLHGGCGKGNVGHGWFLGGYGVGYSLVKRANHTTASGANSIRRMNYCMGWGGVTLDKRIAVTKKITASLGTMLGWGGHTLELHQILGNYDWSQINQNLDSSDNNYMKLKKSYIFVQPKAMLMYHVLSWLAIRGEVGYMYGYSYHSGWNSVVAGDSFEIANSPDTTMQGFTVSIGPWFGW